MSLVSIPASPPLRAEDLPEDPWPRVEILDGRLSVTPMQTNRHRRTVDAVYDALRSTCPTDLAPAHGQPMLRPDSPPGHDLVLIPDVAVVRLDVSAVRDGLGLPPEAFVLAVEVLSPSTRANDLDIKATRYRAYGVGEYWTIDPLDGVVQVHWSGGRGWLAKLAAERFPG